MSIISCVFFFQAEDGRRVAHLLLEFRRVLFRSANIRAYAVGNEQGDFLRQRDLVLVGLGEQDRDARLEIGWFDRDRQPPSETRLQALINAVDVLRITIRCQYDLLATINQRIEGVEKLLLRALLVGKEVNIRSEEHTSELQSLMRISHAAFGLKK